MMPNLTQIKAFGWSLASDMNVTLKLFHFETHSSETVFDDSHNLRRQKKIVEDVHNFSTTCDDKNMSYLHNCDEGCGSSALDTQKEHDQPINPSAMDKEANDEPANGRNQDEYTTLKTVKEQMLIRTSKRKTFWISYFVVALLVLSFVGEASSYSIAERCGIGHFCSLTLKKCVPCSKGTYMDQSDHQYISCFICDEANPLKRTIIRQNCTSTSNAVQGCEDGYYDTKEDIHDLMCQRCESYPQPCPTFTTQVPRSRNLTTPSRDSGNGTTQAINNQTGLQNYVESGVGSGTITAVVVCCVVIAIVMVVAFIYLRKRKIVRNKLSVNESELLENVKYLALRK